MLLSGINPVYAQDPTPTTTPPPTATFRPLFPTATPAPTQLYECNGVQPSGWGVVTPNPYWLMNCRHCITPIPVGDWGDNVNLPTVDPELGFGDQTPTPPPGGGGDPGDHDIQLFYSLDGTNYTEILYNEVKFINTYPKKTLILKLVKNNPTKDLYELVGINMVGEGNLTTPYSDWPATLYHEISTIDLNTKGYFQVIDSNIPNSPVMLQPQDIAYNQGFNSQPLYICTSTSGCDYEFDYTFNLEIGMDVEYDDQLGFIYKWRPNGVSYSNTNLIEIQWKYGGYTESPSAPPDQTACSVVVPKSEGPGSDTGIEIPYIGIGNDVCFAIGGQEIPLGWLDLFLEGEAPTTFTIPGIRICFTEIRFGVLNILGVEVDLDYLAFGMAAILLFRMITRS